MEKSVAAPRVVPPAHAAAAAAAEHSFASPPRIGVRGIIRRGGGGPVDKRDWNPGRHGIDHQSSIGPGSPLSLSREADHRQASPRERTRAASDDGMLGEEERHRRRERAGAAAGAAAGAGAAAREELVAEASPPQPQPPVQQQQQQGASVANAALVARGALKSGYLWKMGSNVPRWKRRYFVLKPITMLFYYMSEHDTEPRGCIDLDLFDAVRKVKDTNSSTSRCESSAGSASSGAGPAGAGAGGSGGGGGGRTTFELYRSGCPDGSGFMLEARGGEDWEHWVESIANGRHGKMQAEMDVVKGANKLLLDEISGLEHQVATFRGYANQRHVAILALGDERKKNMEVASELASLGDAAAGILRSMAAAASLTTANDAAHPAEASLNTGELAAPAAGGGSRFECVTTATATAVDVSRDDGVGGGHDTGDAGRIVSSSHHSCGPSGPSSPSVADENRRTSEAVDERGSLEAIRYALDAARASFDRRTEALGAERALRLEVEGRVQGAEVAAREADERAAAAEAAAARCKGRVSVLERNVEYLQSQQRGFRRVHTH